MFSFPFSERFSNQEDPLGLRSQGHEKIGKLNGMTLKIFPHFLSLLHNLLYERGLTKEYNSHAGIICFPCCGDGWMRKLK